MSFRELRNFTEIMRALGYPRLISLEDFRTANFELVADILYWLVQRYDPNTDITDNITTESDRVTFLKSVTILMFSKARIKLNTKKLYGADGYAVQELLKIADMLYGAVDKNPGGAAAAVPGIEDSDSSSLPGDFNFLSKLADLKLSRELASEITTRGATLYDLLGKESDLRDSRQKAISRKLELEDIEKSVRETIAGVHQNVNELERNIQNLGGDEKSLEDKIEKKRAELERNEKRLKSIQSVRPAFMDELEKMEKDLQKLYAVYLERFRNLDYLEHELATYNKQEMEKIEKADRELKRMQKRLREEENNILHGKQEVEDSAMDDGNFDFGGDDIFDNEARVHQPSKRPNSSGKKLGGKTKAQVFGAITGGDSDESESDISGEDFGSESGSSQISIADGMGSSEDLIDDDDDGDELSDDNFGGADDDDGHNSDASF